MQGDNGGADLAQERPGRIRLGRLGVFLELIKARLTLLVVATTAVGFYAAGGARLGLSSLAPAILGTALTAGGSMALNQVWEWSRDARMDRTRERPIPTRRIARFTAVLLAIAMILTGLAVLLIWVNLLTAVLALIVVGVYVLAYTPMKARTPFCTLVGAVCGAIPPMMGWSAATGRLEYGAWILGATLFVWQIPHFLALAWLYREDYERGGFRMLPVLDPSGKLTSQVALIYAVALLPLGLAAVQAGIGGWFFLVGSTILGLGFLTQAARLLVRRTGAEARILFIASLVYLTFLLVLMVSDPGPISGPMIR